MKVKRSKPNTKHNLFILWLGVGLAALGIVLLAVFNILTLTEYANIGFGVMILGILITFFGFIIRRMQKLGIDYFVSGAIIAYLGYILIALPAIMYAFGHSLFDNDYLNLIPISVGILLIILGFFTETYELNKKLMKALTQIGSAIKSIFLKINWRLVFSPVNILSVAGITTVILTFYGVFDQFLEPWEGYVVGSLLILLNLAFHFREELATILKNIARLTVIIFNAIIRGIKQIPTIVKEVVLWLRHAIITLANWSWKAIKFTIIHNYFLLFAFGIVLFFIIDDFSFEVRFAFSALVCLVAVIKPLVEWRHELANRLTSVRARVYRTAKRTRRFVTRKLHCPFCDHEIKTNTRYCPKCGRELPICWICSMPIESKDSVAQCPHCLNLFHYNHFNAWIQMKRACPVCKKEIKSTQAKNFTELNT